MKRYQNLAILLCILLLAACGSTNNTTTPTATPLDDVTAMQQEVQQTLAPHIDAAKAALQQNPRDDLSKQTTSYETSSSYDTLTETEKAVYDDLLKKMRNFEYFKYTPHDDGFEMMDLVMNVYGSIVDDHPEIACYVMIGELFDDKGNPTGVDSMYFHPKLGSGEEAEIEQIKAEMERLTYAAEWIVQNMPQDASTYDKYRYLAYVISGITEYNHQHNLGDMTSNPYGAILGGGSICQGYATGMQYLCQLANLWCRVAEGESQGVAHGWNLVMLDDGSYHIDITWSDDGINEIGSPGWMRYYMLTQQMIEQDHIVYEGYESTGKTNYLP
ncbi:hypothetical protein LJC55_02825 [Eubacteriales bacterium OttesenSCG-928-N14]|nr:hypothetical protein [Eubacteriales bacterium OttesenSCG-928-N14]